MARAQTENTTAKRLARASILNSLLLPLAAVLHLVPMFWVLSGTNFVLLHSIWLVQLERGKSWRTIDFDLAKRPLIAFAVLGNLPLLLWGERLMPSSFGH